MSSFDGSSFGTSTLSAIPVRFEGGAGDSDDESGGGAGSGVQLGFAEPVETRVPLLFQDEAWKDWDGGIAGGRPVWLDGKLQVPRCCACGKERWFVAQIYAPRDDEEDAFHRCIYVFVCGDGDCAAKQSVVALRCQLPRANARYAFDSPDYVEKDLPAAAPTARTFPRFEVVVEPEPDASTALPLGVTVQVMDEAPSTEDQELELQLERQLELDQPNAADASTLHFLGRVDRAPSQVLRYDRGGQPLWHGLQRRPPPGTVPNCEHCGAEREFEFQLMPQLLHYLKVDGAATNHARPVDFAALAVYSCKASCANFRTTGAHAVEFAWLQTEAPPEPAGKKLGKQAAKRAAPREEQPQPDEQPGPAATTQ
ncbi:programmed cell death protein 2 [Pelagophyceae sp. CCMP2097]|nr:programmed cell death protein 2 [Pelagophyceae sp. CCMP2097]